jgi:hypothetical protein
MLNHESVKVDWIVKLISLQHRGGRIEREGSNRKQVLLLERGWTNVSEGRSIYKIRK